MPEPAVAAVRRFNRFYTKQIGVLEEGLLRSPFSLTEVRVLYELAHSRGLSAVQLCETLALDAGYLSRILRRFQRAKLVARTPALADRRRRVLTLTGRGRRTFATLDARQNQDVAALLAGVSPVERRRLVASLRAVERILGAPSAQPPEPYRLRRHRPGDMGWITHRHGVLYQEEYGYDERFEALVAGVVADFIARLDPARERCWIAERDGEIVGSIFLVRKSATVAKLRLLYVEPAARGLGIGARLIDECIRFARAAGYRKITLWTQSELRAARHLYEKAGFDLVKQQRHRTFTRRELTAETWELDLTRLP